MIQAADFYKKLVQRTKGVFKETYGDNPVWTAQMKFLITQVIKEAKLDIEISHEYYRIDCIGWIQRKGEIREQCEIVKLNPHFWDLDVAVEYEKNSMEWLDEVCKLSYIRCPLRVVIGYGLENTEEKIALAKAILEKTNAITDNEQEFQIILGRHANEFQEGAPNPCGFQSWVITKSEVKKIS